MHHGSMGWAPTKLPAYPAMYKNNKPHSEKQSKFFLRKKNKREIKKTLSWKIGDVVTGANAVPQPNGHDPERGSTPPGGMDALTGAQATPCPIPDLDAWPCQYATSRPADPRSHAIHRGKMWSYCGSALHPKCSCRDTYWIYIMVTRSGLPSGH